MPAFEGYGIAYRYDSMRDLCRLFELLLSGRIGQLHVQETICKFALWQLDSGDDSKSHLKTSGGKPGGSSCEA